MPLESPTAPALGMILKGFPRISETFISNEILLLEQLGFRIHLFSMRHPRESFAHESVRRIQAAVDYLPSELLRPLPQLLPPNIRLLVQSPAAYGAAFMNALKRFRRTRKSATFKHLLQAGYLVEKLLPGRGIRHLHAHFAHSPTSVAFFASRLSGLPFSFTAHAKDIYTSDPRQLREKIAHARFVVTCTGYNQVYLKRIAGTAAVPVHRVYHGIDTRLFSGPAQAARRLQAPYQILTVARLTPKKGLTTVYRALRHLADHGVLFQHTLIGDGDDGDRIQDEIRRLNLQDSTRWLGTLPHDQVLQHYRRADLFVLGCEIAANGDRDGIPNVLIESMAMGVPVAATRVSAIPELVQNEATGLLVPPGCPHALADAMKRLLADEALRNRIIPAARKRVLADFDNRTHIRRLAAIFRREVPVLRPE